MIMFFLKKKLIIKGTNAPQSFMYLPLISKDKKLGVITVQSPKSGVYQEHNLVLLQTFDNQILNKHSKTHFIRWRSLASAGGR